MHSKKIWALGFVTLAFITLPYINRANAAIDVEIYTDKDAFINRLGGTNAVRVINFDDIDTNPTDPVEFPADRYQVSHGIRITGESGQFASKNFGFPQDFVPVSVPNMYAPGPIDNSSTSGHAGGKSTEVLFFSGNIVALTAGFGLFFIDADWPSSGPCSMTVYNLSGTQIKTTGIVTTSNAQAAFRGFITIDTNTNQPVPLIARASIINGSGWPGNDDNEGAALDDFVFAIPTTAPVATTNTASGITTSGATLNGTVNANNESTTVTFQYGLTTAYGSTVTADQSPVKGNTDTPVSKGMTGMSADTTYHYRVVAASSAGTTNGGDQAFKTLMAPTPGILIYLPLVLR